MANDNQATKVIVGPVRFSYLHIWEPAAIGEGDDKKYSASLIIPKSNKKLIKEIEAAVQAAIESGKNSKFDGKIPKKLKLPLRDGDEEREDEAYAGAMFLNTTSKTKPGIVDKNSKPIQVQDNVYSGCYGYASVNFYAFDSNGSKGIACGLNHIMKIKDGEPLGGRSTAESDFEGLSFDDDDDDNFL